MLNSLRFDVGPSRSDYVELRGRDFDVNVQELRQCMLTEDRKSVV